MGLNTAFMVALYLFLFVCFALLKTISSALGVLFTLFDGEVDPRLRADIRESIVSLLQSLSCDNLNHWLSMCKQVLLASKEEAGKSAGKKEGKGRPHFLFSSLNNNPNPHCSIAPRISCLRCTN